MVIEARWAEGQVERLPALAAELVRLPVDVIFAGGLLPLRAAQQATSTIPIVAIDLQSDPVAMGLAASLASSGWEISPGYSWISRIERQATRLLREAMPGISVWLSCGTRPPTLPPLRPCRSRPSFWGDTAHPGGRAALTSLSRL